MMKDKNQCNACRMVLEEETVRYGGMILEYRLLICRKRIDRFRIRITQGEESAEYGIGDRLEAALERYRLLVRGRVTPCCLREVLEELCG